MSEQRVSDMADVRTRLQSVVADALGDNNNGNLSKFVADAVIAAGFGPVQA